MTVGQSVNTPAADRAAQVPVPRRLHLEHGPPRDEGRRQLHLRADARHHVLDRPAAAVHAPRPTAARRPSRPSPTTARSAARAASAAATIPNNQYAFYLQDAWRVDRQADARPGRALRPRDRLRVRPGREHHLRRRCRTPAGAGRLDGPGRLRGLRQGARGGHEQHRSARWASPTTSRATASCVLRGGAGRYYDFAYTNANILFAVIGAQSSFGQIYSHTNSSGIRNADGTLLPGGPAAAAPTSSAPSPTPLPSHAASPLIKQPYTDQANLGFAKALGKRLRDRDGRRLRARPGPRPAPAPQHPHERRHVAAPPGGPPRANVAAANFRIDISEGVSHYKGVSLAVKKQWDGKLQLLGSYTLSESTSNTSLRATDEFGEYDVLDAIDPFADNQENPTRTDTRHRVDHQRRVEPRLGPHVSPRSSATSRSSPTTSSPASTTTGRPQLRPAGGCRDAQQRPRRGLPAARPARLQAVPHRRQHRRRADRRGLQPDERHEPGRLRRQPDGWPRSARRPRSPATSSAASSGCSSSARASSSSRPLTVPFGS